MAMRKVTVNLPEEQVKFLQKLAKRNHMTFTDALRRAITSEEFFIEQEDSGRKILVEEEGQRLREIFRK